LGSFQRSIGDLDVMLWDSCHKCNRPNSSAETAVKRIKTKMDKIAVGIALITRAQFTYS
jgi:hypothetical protein